MSTADVIALAGVIVATLALIVAFAAMIWQARQTHASSSVDNMWRFLDEWDSPQMQQVRVKACRSLKAKGDGDDIADLLNFFEELGFLVHQSALDSNTAWAMFSDWALPYWRAADYYVKIDQDRDPGLGQGDQGKEHQAGDVRRVSRFISADKCRCADRVRACAPLRARRAPERRDAARRLRAGLP